MVYIDTNLPSWEEKAEADPKKMEVPKEKHQNLTPSPKLNPEAGRAEAERAEAERAEAKSTKLRV